MFTVLMVFSRAHLTSTVQLRSSYPIRLTTTANSTCPSHEEIDTFRRNIKYVIEEIPLTRPYSYGGSGWTRVAYLNKSDPQQICPSNWNLTTSPVRGCGRSFTGGQTCDSVVYPVNGRSYSLVCGNLMAYHTKLSLGFHSAWVTRNISIEEIFVSGVSITHGPLGARQHVWTFVGALNEIDNEFNG